MDRSKQYENPPQDLVEEPTNITRRELILGGAACVTMLTLSQTLSAAPAHHAGKPHRVKLDRLITRDGTSLFFKDWGKGPTMVFCHGWPLSSDAWDAQMLFFLQHGFRVIAHDRRGHGRSQQTSSGNTMDQYADDLADLFEALDLRDVILVGHSTGAAEVVRYIGRHGTKRVSKAVLISTITPLRLQTTANPMGTPIASYDDLRATVLHNRAQFLQELSDPFFGYNKPGVVAMQGVRDELWREGMQASIVATYDGIKTQSETDFTRDLRRIDVPTLLVHGEDDQLVPLNSSATITKKLIRNSSLNVYSAAPHGLIVTHADKVNADVLTFSKRFY